MFYNLHLNLLLKTLHTSLNKQLLSSFAQRQGQSWDWKMDQQPILAITFETSEAVALETLVKLQHYIAEMQLQQAA